MLLEEIMRPIGVDVAFWDAVVADLEERCWLLELL